jgi:plastocyanin
MKNTYIIIIALILIAVGVWFLVAGDNKVEAPMPEDNLDTEEVVGETMPIMGESDTEEMVVIEDSTAVKEFTVSSQNFSFTPASLTVQKGDKVKITFKNTAGFHDFKIDEYGVAAKQAQAPSEEVLEFTADKSGSFAYYCSVGSHRAQGMEGMLIVE